MFIRVPVQSPRDFDLQDVAFAVGMTVIPRRVRPRVRQIDGNEKSQIAQNVRRRRRQSGRTRNTVRIPQTISGICPLAQCSGGKSGIE